MDYCVAICCPGADKGGMATRTHRHTPAARPRHGRGSPSPSGAPLQHTPHSVKLYLDL